MSKKAKLDPNGRYRNWCIVLWCEDPTHNEAAARLIEEYNCVGCLHNRDTKKKNFIDEDNLCESDHKASDYEEYQKPHYHFIVKFKNAVYRKPLAKELGITENYIVPCESWYGAAKYLLHVGHPDKYQYDTYDLVGSLRSSVADMVDELPTEEVYIEIINHIDDTKRSITDCELQRYCINSGFFRTLRSCQKLLSSYLISHNNLYIKKENEKEV